MTRAGARKSITPNGNATSPGSSPRSRTPQPKPPPNPKAHLAPNLDHARASPCGLDTIIDAAEEVVLRDGIGRLTLSAVALEAGLSKSGLLHHFPSKDALIDAMVERTVRSWRVDFEHAVAEQPVGPGRVARASLSVCMASDARTWTRAQRRRGLVLVAALVHDRKHVKPVREAHEFIRERFAADGLAPGAAEAVMLAADGLWFGWIFGLRDPLADELAAIRSALGSLVTAQPARPTRNQHKRPQPRPARAARSGDRR